MSNEQRAFTFLILATLGRGFHTLGARGFFLTWVGGLVVAAFFFILWYMED